MNRTRANLNLFLVLLLALVLSSGGGGIIAPAKAATIIMLYEAQHGSLSSDATGAARELRDAGRDVKIADDDEETGPGEIPAWLKPALEPGRKIMGGADDESQKDDALILLNGERVVKAIKMPATKAEILEAVK